MGLSSICASFAPLWRNSSGGSDGVDLRLRPMTEPTLKTRSKTSAEANDFREVLRREFAVRTQANPRYSLRAFAKSLGVYHATLSALMAGRRPMTPKTIEQISASLGLSPSECARFTGNKIRQKTAESRQDFVLLEDEEFDLIASWRHDALIEYLQLPRKTSKDHDVRRIASRLCLSPADVMTSLQLLQRAGQIVREDDGFFRPVARNTSTLLRGEQTSTARRVHQKELLEKSKEALLEVSLDERDHSSIVMTIDSEDLPELKEAIRSFRRKLMAFAQRKDATPDQVYSLQISLFPLTKNHGG